jgi:hypothetical protein
MRANWSVVLGTAVALALCAAAQEPPACGLFAPGAGSARSSACLSCHRSHAGEGNHATDIPYPGAGQSDLRPAEEVLRRGVRMPGGQVRCATCHDAASPWKYRVALPRGAPALRAVNLRDRSTYERPPLRAQPGDEVGARPLCLACHALD